MRWRTRASTEHLQGHCDPLLTRSSPPLTGACSILGLLLTGARSRLGEQFLETLRRAPEMSIRLMKTIVERLAPP